MADRRNQQERGQWGTTGAGVGAPGTTGAFKTSDPLGAPGSTGAGLTSQDPTAIPTRADYDVDYPDMESGGMQQQQRRHPTSGEQHHQFHDPTSGGGGQYQELRDPTSGVYGGGGHHQQQQQLRDPTRGVIGSGDEFERDRAGHGPVGVTGFTRVTTATAPGEDVIYHGRETVAEAQDLGPAGGGRSVEEKRVFEKGRELKDRV